MVKAHQTSLEQCSSNFKILLHSIIEQNVQKNPNKHAVSFAGQHLTYKELNIEANKLAHYLIFKGIEPESRVAVCLRPGFEIIITLLAIQKAGGVYLPIDPDYSQARIKSIYEDAAVELTISQKDVIENLGDILSEPIDFQQTKSISNLNWLNNPQVNICEQNTAYIFYTSGTTGSPKGIAIAYQSFAYYVISAIDKFGMNAKDTTLTIAKFSFSISLFELMTSIVSGGRLIILPRAEVMDYGRLATALEQASVVHIGPNLFKGLVSYIRNTYRTYERFSGLRHVSSGGDVVPAELLEELKKIFASAEIYVIYGCTEIACMGCYYLIPRNTVVKKSYIGIPFEGTEAILLSEDGSKIANDEIGEICFRGPGVMKGYLNRAELTENALIKIGNATYFKTGDFGRLSSSGNLEYLGRRDFQIKLRGQRLELLDIESHLRQAPGVLDAVVSTNNVGGGDKRLIAYITLKDQNCFSLDAVRAYLRNLLPDYMRPTGWVVLEKMPLNENFKIARKALPVATVKNLIITETYVKPANETERILATIWQNVLGIPQVGVNDNFFNIGGDSLSAMNISMLSAENGIGVSPLQIVSTPTIAGLVASGVEQNRERKSYKTSDLSSGFLPDLPPFISRFLYERGSQAPHQWNISRILTAKKNLSFELIEKTLSDLGERHDALRLRFTCDADSRWYASILKNSADNLVCKQVDLSNLSETQQTEKIVEVAQAYQKEINLISGPIACLILFDLGKERSPELFFVVHHFAMDVISWKIFWLEFELLYQRLERESEATLSTSLTSFKSWTQVLRQYANSAAVEQDVRQWIQQPWSKVYPLPRDLSDEHSNTNLNTNSSARVIHFALSPWQTQSLIRRGTQKLNVEHILISSLAVALGNWQANDLVHFDRLVHGRNVGLSEFDLSRTLGCIISYAPTLLKIDTQASLNTILLDVAQQMEQRGNSEASIDLYRYLGAKPELIQKLEELPKAEVLFNYRGKVEDVLERSSLFGKTRTVAGLDHNPEGLRQYPLAIVVDIIKQKLEVRCVYSSNIHKHQSIKALCAEFLNRLVSYIV